MTEKIFNPLYATKPQVSTSSVPGVSTSALTNTQVGICPKCNRDMVQAVLANQDSVLFCEVCTVSSPMPDA